MNHVSMPRNRAVPASDTLRVHWSAGPVPVARFALVEPVENALVHIARLPVRDAASGLSDSGLETLPVSRLAASGIRVSQQVMLEGHKVDGLIGDRLVLQSDGFSFHSSAEQRRADIAHDRRLALLGSCAMTTGKSCSTGPGSRTRSSGPWPNVCTCRRRKIGDSEITRMLSPISSS